MTSEQDRILDLAREWIRTESTKQKCVESCEYDADYFCYREIQAERAAAERLWEAIDSYIRGISNANSQGTSPKPTLSA